MSALQPVIPILSLPSAVLFPHALLDLNLEGERLLKNAGEWLADGAIWGIATWRGNMSPEWEPSIPVYRTLGIGSIVHRDLRNGSIRRLVIEGLVRGKIIGACRTSTPAAIQVEFLHDHLNVEGTRRKNLSQAFGELVRTARQVATIDSALRDPIRRVLNAHPHPGVVADLLAHACIKDTYARQCILAELDVCRRVRLVHIQIAQATACHAPHPMPRLP